MSLKYTKDSLAKETEVLEVVGVLFLFSKVVENIDSPPFFINALASSTVQICQKEEDFPLHFLFSPFCAAKEEK